MGKRSEKQVLSKGSKALLLGARTLLGAPGLTTRNNPGIATRSKDATREPSLTPGHSGRSPYTDPAAQYPPAAPKDAKDNLVASLLLVVRPGAPSSFVFLVAMPFAPSSVLAPNRNGLQPI